MCVPAKALGKTRPFLSLTQAAGAPRPSPNTETIVLGATWKPILRLSQGWGQAAALLQTAETRDSVSPNGKQMPAPSCSWPFGEAGEMTRTGHQLGKS